MLTVPADAAATLVAVAGLMRDAGDPWWIIGSAAVALHGAEPGTVADIDVLTSSEDAARILPAIGLTATPGAGHDRFRSRSLARWDGAPLPVEFMAGFHHRRRDGKWVPVEPATRCAVKVADATLYIPVRDELHRLLLAFGRPKDLARARELTALR